MHRLLHTLHPLLLAAVLVAVLGGNGWHHHGVVAVSPGPAAVAPIAEEAAPVRTDAGLCPACLLAAPEPTQVVAFRPLPVREMAADSPVAAPAPTPVTRSHSPRAPPVTA